MKWDVGFSWNCRRLTLNGGGGTRRCWSERIDKANRKLLWFDFSIHFPASSRMMWHPTTRQINRDYSTQLIFFSLTFFCYFFDNTLWFSILLPPLMSSILRFLRLSCSSQFQRQSSSRKEEQVHFRWMMPSRKKKSF